MRLKKYSENHEVIACFAYRCHLQEGAMANLHQVLTNLDGKINYVEGHSIAIHQELDLELSTGSGLARVNPNVPMTSLIRMDVLSMSKTITAAGVVHQLLANGLTPQEKIGGHLPGYWSVNPQIANLTFAHVMTHSGGLLGDQADFNQLQALCAAAPGGSVGVGNYQNINYSLLRVLLAYLSSPKTMRSFEDLGGMGSRESAPVHSAGICFQHPILHSGA
jgi:CubicO group peptidase (beta-lactamase class C family)